MPRVGAIGVAPAAGPGPRPPGSPGLRSRAMRAVGACGDGGGRAGWGGVLEICAGRCERVPPHLPKAIASRRGV
jgi:hypothetical protein